MRFLKSWYEWLRKEPASFNATFGWCVATFSVMIMYGLLWMAIITIFHLPCPEQETDGGDPYFHQLMMYTIAPIVVMEEVFFRAPLGLMMSIMRRPQFWPRLHKHAPIVLAVTTLVSSVWFGSMHTYSPVPIMLQGVLGIVFSCLFLKNGGVRGRILKPLFFNTVVHIAYNHVFNVLNTFDILASH
jgi:hypothetical protein